ncbi:MAG: hypothetical protein O2930_00910 [Acidobacteria bacterium]|nr:hypothetical protein [Acidobacteriota bacterium]
MPNSQSTHPVRSAEPRDDADRNARIEQLLLTGLDHYFAGQYERAIGVWTRVIFLDRHHDRARAYIDRARSAQAERQRESEELLHVGVSAYNAGDVDRARRLLTQAVEHGSDSADVFLDRLNRADISGPGTGVHGRDEPRPAGSLVRRHRAAPPTARQGWIAAALVAMVVGAVMLVGGLPIGAWLPDLETSAFQAPTSAPSAEYAGAEALPIVRASDISVDRARALYADGRLLEALRALDGIGIADPNRVEAEALRADVQRALFADAGLDLSISASALSGGAR